jgi:hypothetical protein
MDLFEDLVLAGLLDPSKPIQIECLRFCFMPIIREELDGIKEHWNLHRMRLIRGVEGSGGIPEFLYNTPESNSNGGENCGFPVDMHMLDTLSTLFPDMVNPIGCDLDFADWALSDMLVNGLPLPHTLDEALTLYGYLLVQIL